MERFQPPSLPKSRKTVPHQTNVPTTVLRNRLDTTAPVPVLLDLQMLCLLQREATM